MYHALFVLNKPFSIGPKHPPDNCLGTVFKSYDYRVPFDKLREELTKGYCPLLKLIWERGKVNVLSGTEEKFISNEVHAISWEHSDARPRVRRDTCP